MPITKSDIPKLLLAGMRATFFEAYNSSLATNGDWQRISTEVPSTKDTEPYAWLGSVPAMREFVDERILKGLMAHDYSIKNKTWEATIGVDRAAIEDDQYGQIMLRVRQMASEAVRHSNELVFTQLKNGRTTLCYDGQYMIDNDHSEGDSGTQSNYGTTALSVDALWAADVAMRGFKDDTGKVLNIIPDTLVVPPALQRTARELLESTYIPGADLSMTKNVLIGMYNLIVSPYLTDTTDWFLVCTTMPVRPVIFQNRLPVEFQQLEANSDTGFMRDQYAYGVRKRCNTGHGLWQTVYGSIVSGG